MHSSIKSPFQQSTTTSDNIADWRVRLAEQLAACDPADPRPAENQRVTDALVTPDVPPSALETFTTNCVKRAIERAVDASTHHGQAWTRCFSQKRLLLAGLSLGLTVSMAAAGLAAVAHQRYSDRTLTNIPLASETIEGLSFTGENIHFQQLLGNQFDISFDLGNGGDTSQLVLRDIDLTLLMPEAPVMAQQNEDLTRWFLTEREFNRQRVVFEAGSPHIDLPEGLSDYSPEDISVSLTNNCLGAGYWELAVSALDEDGNSQKIYQGYFIFPRGAYAKIVSWLNPTSYWEQARTMEAWPGFQFLSGLPFSLHELRRVTVEAAVPVSDLKTEQIMTAGEQIKKRDLIVYNNPQAADSIRTWEDLRQAELKFQSFVPPGIYDESKLWDSDFSQLATVVRGIGREIASPLSEQPLTEVEIDFENKEGALRKLIVSGIDLEQVPQLDSADYAEGVYMPLGFGTPFTQSYEDLKANPPAQSPFFSVVLNSNNEVIDYRKDIGINGLVMHRDLNNPNLLHVYPMSYERITLVGHYVVDLNFYTGE
ncbi:MAG: hypothetical protein AAFR58_15945 [Cyanobacteria bacterium J06627_28]